MAAPMSPARWIAVGLTTLVLVSSVEIIRRRVQSPPGGTVRPVAPVEPRIVVFPFGDATGAGRTWFGDGLAGDVAQALGAIDGFVVRPRSLDFEPSAMAARSSAPFRDDTSAIRIARDLGASIALTGTVSLDNGRTEILIRLLGVDDRRLIWSGTYWRDRAALPAFAAELTLAVGEALHATPSPSLDRVLAQEQLDHPGAFDLYLEGLVQRQRGNPTSLRRAAALFREATRRDPRFPRAWGALAWALQLLGEHGADTAPHAEWRSAVERAVALDSLSGEAVLRQAVLRFRLDRDRFRASVGFERALRISPGSLDAHLEYAKFLVATGRRDSALALLDRAMLGDPWYGEIKQRILGSDWGQHEARLR